MEKTPSFMTIVNKFMVNIYMDLATFIIVMKLVWKLGELSIITMFVNNQANVTIKLVRTLKIDHMRKEKGPRLLVPLVK